jgi:hypothetical protein
MNRPGTARPEEFCVLLFHVPSRVTTAHWRLGGRVFRVGLTECKVKTPPFPEKNLAIDAEKKETMSS